MKKALVILSFSLLSCGALLAQRNIRLHYFGGKPEIGVFIGGSYYLGDLNQYRQFYNTKPAVGLVYRNNLNSRFALKYNALFGTMEAHDADSRNKYQRNRNLGFKSKIYELSGQIEFKFLPYIQGDPSTPYTPYLFTGLSGFYFNPQAQLDGDWLDLRDLSTEGQGLIPGRKVYSNYQVAIPFGGGMRFNLGRNFGLSFEWGLRKTFTDYLDDVSTTYINPNVLRLYDFGDEAIRLADPSVQASDKSIDKTGYQRGNSSRKDLYSFAGVVFTWRFGNSNSCNFNQ